MKEKNINLLKMIICLLVLLIPSFYFLYNDKISSAGIWLIVSLLVIIIIFPNKLHSFKGAGFEVKIKEIDQAMLDLKVSKEQLTIIMKGVIVPLYTSILGFGRFSSVEQGKKAALVLDDVIKEIGLENDEDVQELQERLCYLDLMDTFGDFSESIRYIEHEDSVNKKAIFEIYENADKMRSNINTHHTIVTKEEAKKIFSDLETVIGNDIPKETSDAYIKYIEKIKNGSF